MFAWLQGQYRVRVDRNGLTARAALGRSKFHLPADDIVKVEVRPISQFSRSFMWRYYLVITSRSGGERDFMCQQAPAAAEAIAAVAGVQVTLPNPEESISQRMPWNSNKQPGDRNKL